MMKRLMMKRLMIMRHTTNDYEADEVVIWVAINGIPSIKLQISTEIGKNTQPP